MYKLKLTNSPLEVIVDFKIFKELQFTKIWLNDNGYPSFYKSSEKRKYLLHRYVMKAKLGQLIDHIQRNKLDARECNLRFTTNGDNVRNSKLSKSNTSGHRGIDNKGSTEFPYRVYLYFNKRRIYLGCYKEQLVAELEYRRWHGILFPYIQAEMRGKPKP